MPSVFEFLNLFRGLLRDAGIRFALTSGMASVRYGLQQTTKDSDWIVDPSDLPALRHLLETLERRTPPAVVAYRPIFGAPLDERWHRGGWTTHISVRMRPDELDHHLDFFGRPPRAPDWQADPDDPDFADRDTVARMKKTDRDRDWPIVNSLGSQASARQDPKGLYHIQSARILRMAWRDADAAARAEANRRRPLLQWLEREPDDLRIEALIRAERLIWESVNRYRYHLYLRLWKEFYREWQTEHDWHWPNVEPFLEQHGRLVSAAERHRLPCDPLSAVDTRLEIYRAGMARASALANLPEESLREIAPPPVGDSPVSEPEYPEWYYEMLAETMGEEAAAWARLPREERERELTLLHQNFNTPDDLSLWPAELDGGADRP